MIGDPLAQTERLNQMQQSVRHQFQEGGSVWSVVLAMVMIAAVLWLALVWSRRVERNRQPGATLDTVGVFGETLRRLDLRGPHRGLLIRAARTSGLEHPTVLLLSPRLFDRYIGTAASSHRPAHGLPNPRDPAPSSPVEHTIAELRAYLFPEGSTPNA